MFEATQVEQRLIKSAEAGELLDLSDEPDRDVRAVVIRDLLCERHTEPLDPRGVRLQGARIIGTLDLTDVCAQVPLVLTACEFEERIILERAHLPYLNLSDSRFPVLYGDDFVCEHDADLSGIRTQRIELTDAKITGVLSLSRARLEAADAPAFEADRLTVTGNVFLGEGFHATSNSNDGTLRFLGATIGGQLNLRGAHLEATNGPALNADGLAVSDSMFLNHGQASSGSSDGTIRLVGANIGGQLSLRGARLEATNGPALVANGLTVTGYLFLDEGFQASSDSRDGTLRLGGATISGQLNLRNAEIRNRSDSSGSGCGRSRGTRRSVHTNGSFSAQT